MLRKAVFKRLRRQPGTPRYARDAEFGIISLGASIVGTICLAAFFLSPGTLDVLFFAGIIAAAIGIVFGAIGLNRSMKGLAISGMILGIVDVLGAIVGGLLLIFYYFTVAGC